MLLNEVNLVERDDIKKRLYDLIPNRLKRRNISDSISQWLIKSILNYIDNIDTKTLVNKYHTEINP